MYIGIDARARHASAGKFGRVVEEDGKGERGAHLRFGVLLRLMLVMPCADARRKTHKIKAASPAFVSRVPSPPSSR
jgi:hypothetical protein